MNDIEIKNAYKQFLINQGYSLKTPSGHNSTVYDYQKRIDYVCEIENFDWEKLAENIDSILLEYSPDGIKAELGAKSHGAVISALRQYQHFIKGFYLKESKTSISNNFLKSELEKRQISYKERKDSFYEITIQGKSYLLKCRTYNNNYTFVSKSEIPNLVDNIIFTLVEWINNKPSNIYLIPMCEWKNSENTILKDRNYTGLNSQPEWGVDINKSNKHELAKYHIDKIVRSIKDNANKRIIEEIENPENKEAEKQALIKIRLGHSKLRERVLESKKECDICGLNHPKLLVASHIKAWAQSDNEEKLDEENILLLCSMHDALFDKGLISFDDNGKILISSSLSENNQALANVNEDSSINIVSEKQKEYLKWHRENIFIK